MLFPFPRDPWAKIRATLLLLAHGCLVGGWCAAANLEEDADYLQAREALRAGLPSVAARKAEALLARKGAGWTPREGAELAELAAEGWLRAGQPDQVLALLSHEPKPHGAVYWRGQALLLKNDLAAAELVLTEYHRGGRFAERARLALAQVYLASGQESAARRELQELRQSADPELAARARLMFNESELRAGREGTVLGRLTQETAPMGGAVTLLKAKSLLELGRLTEAEDELKPLLKSVTGGERLHQAATLVQVEGLIRQGKEKAAQSLLVNLIVNAPGTEYLWEAFEMLDRINESLIDSSGGALPSELLDWSARSGQPLLQGYALFVLANAMARQDRVTEALGLVEALIKQESAHPKESDAMRKAMEWHGALGHDHRVLGLAEAWRQKYGGGGESMVDFLAGSIQFTRGDFQEALARFQRSADLTESLPERRRSLYNAAVAAMKAGEMAVYAALLGQMQVVSSMAAQGASSAQAGAASGETAADMELDRAMELAEQSDPGAAPELLRFLDQNPGHGREVEARIALAELALLDSPPRVRSAESSLLEAESGLGGEESDALRQRIAYTRLWCREAEADWKGVTEAGLRFLRDWPQAELAAEVQMKVADAYFRQEDFANARTQFELVAKTYPQSTFADAAMFFAGRAAMNLMNTESLNAAIEFWEELAEQGGPLGLAARIQQALAKRREGKEVEALKVVDTLLAEKEMELETRRLLTCERAELLLLIGAVDPTRLPQAVASLKAFIAGEGLPYAWFARAGFLLATALRAQGAPDAALEACNDVVEAASFDLGGDPGELQSYYKAGFLAVELLQEHEQWEGAARMAERLAATGGERAVEAKDIATKIRLERFLWDEKS